MHNGDTAKMCFCPAKRLATKEFSIEHCTLLARGQ
jgi:hypothetical protein